MKYLIPALLLVSTSVLAQGYGYYPQQQHYDHYEMIEQQRRLQQEFLDQQFTNQLILKDLQQWDYEKRERERCEKINPLSLNC